MAKIVYAPLSDPKAGRLGTQPPKSPSLKTVRTPDGSKIRIASVDADSPTFSQDLTTAFRRNVARLRRENKRLAEDVNRCASDP